MSTRFSILAIVACFTFAAAVAQAKTAPSLQTAPAFGHEPLQQLIDELPKGELCRVAPSQGRDDADDLTVGAVFDGADGRCAMPAPLPDPFEHLARL